MPKKNNKSDIYLSCHVSGMLYFQNIKELIRISYYQFICYHMTAFIILFSNPLASRNEVL